MEVVRLSSSARVWNLVSEAILAHFAANPGWARRLPESFGTNVTLVGSSHIMVGCPTVVVTVVAAVAVVAAVQ